MEKNKRKWNIFTQKINEILKFTWELNLQLPYLFDPVCLFKFGRARVGAYYFPNIFGKTKQSVKANTNKP